MTAQVWTVYINGNAVPNVQSMDISVGRQSVQDPFRASTINISGRDLSTFVTPTIGWVINIYCGATVIYNGRVANCSIEYGIIASEDRWTVQGEDALADAGRAITTVTWAANTSTYVAAYNAANFTGVTVINLNAVASSSYCSAQSFVKENLLGILQTLATTEQARLVGAGPYTLGWIGRAGATGVGYLYDFTDGTVATAKPTANYNAVTFASMVDNYADKVVISPSGLAQVTAGSGNFVRDFQSYDISDTQATNLAGYVRNTLSVSSTVPSSVSFLSEAESSATPITGLAYTNLGASLGVILRGTKYNCILEGFTMSVTPEYARGTVYLSSAEAYSFLTLNDAVYGTLDNNKLGF
jgi:hypothetical protein